MHVQTKHDLSLKHMPVQRSEIVVELVGIIQRSGMPVYQIADDANVSRNTIGRWLDGTTIHPRMHTMIAVAEVLGYKFVLLPNTKN